MGQPVVAALGRASLVRHAQHGGAHRQWGDGPLSPAADWDAGGGHSWLPFWMARLDEHAHSIAAALPPLQHKPSDYVLSGRYFQSIEIPRGPTSPRPSSTSW